MEWTFFIQCLLWHMLLNLACREDFGEERGADRLGRKMRIWSAIKQAISAPCLFLCVPWAGLRTLGTMDMDIGANRELQEKSSCLGLKRRKKVSQQPERVGRNHCFVWFFLLLLCSVPAPNVLSLRQLQWQYIGNSRRLKLREFFSGWKSCGPKRMGQTLPRSPSLMPSDPKT